MKLTDWIHQFPREQRKAIRDAMALHVGVSEITIRNYANENRPVPIEQAPKIQHFTVSYTGLPKFVRVSGQKVRNVVTVHDLTPDADWNLIGQSLQQAAGL